MKNSMDTVEDTETSTIKLSKRKKGIIYLSSIPPYMNVARIKEFFGQYGDVGNVYLQLSDIKKDGVKKSKKINNVNKYTEGWVEFQKKHIAKKVAQHLNNKQVNSRKKSKHYDSIWNIKYLSNFKWAHLHERLAYEKQVRRQKLRNEISLAKKKTNYFTLNLKKISKKDVKNIAQKDTDDDVAVSSTEPAEVGREEFLKSLFV